MALLMLLLFYIQISIMQISTETDNQKHRKSIATEKSAIFKKIVLKFQNPKCNISCKVVFILFSP